MARNSSFISRVVVAVLCFGVLAVAVPMVVSPTPIVVWNATSSVPVGLYRVSKPSFTRGEMVLAETPEHVRALASERRYIPGNVPLAKRIAAISGDKICSEGQWIYVNGERVAQRLERDSQGREMPTWAGCRALKDEVFLLLPEVKSSFDGRYFGPMPRQSVIGKLTPLWTREVTPTLQ